MKSYQFKFNGREQDFYKMHYELDGFPLVLGFFQQQLAILLLILVLKEKNQQPSAQLIVSPVLSKQENFLMNEKFLKDTETKFSSPLFSLLLLKICFDILTKFSQVKFNSTITTNNRNRNKSHFGKENIFVNKYFTHQHCCYSNEANDNTCCNQ
jgi:hypothetical protein